MSVTTVIALILMTLKLLGKITLAWKWIVLIWLSPFALAFGILAIELVIAGFIFLLNKKLAEKNLVEKLYIK